MRRAPHSRRDRVPCRIGRRPPPTSTLFPYTTLFRSTCAIRIAAVASTRGSYGGFERISSARSSGAEIRGDRSEEHTSELQSLRHLVCRLLLEKQKNARGRSAGRRRAATASRRRAGVW